MNRELVFKRYRVSASENEAILEMDGGDSCMTIQLCLSQETVRLKIKMVNYVIYILLYIVCILYVHKIYKSCVSVATEVTIYVKPK